MALHRCMIIYGFSAANVIPTCPPQLLTNSPPGLPCASSLAIPTITKDTAALTSPPIASSSRGMSSLMKLPFPLLIAMDHALLRHSSFLILLTLCLILLDHSTSFCLQEFSPAILDRRQPPQAPPRLRPRTLWCRPLCRCLRCTSHQDGTCRPPLCHTRHRRPFSRHARHRRHRLLRPHAPTASRLHSTWRRCPRAPPCAAHRRASHLSRLRRASSPTSTRVGNTWTLFQRHPHRLQRLRSRHHLQRRFPRVLLLSSQ
jgi:hypothetical protein